MSDWWETTVCYCVGATIGAVVADSFGWLLFLWLASAAIFYGMRGDE